MIFKLKLFLISLFLCGAAFIISPLSTTAYDPLNAACTGQAANSAVCNPSINGNENPVSGTHGVISRVANIVAIVAAIGAVVNIMIGAFEFVTAGGTGFKNAQGGAGAAPTRAAKARSRVASGIIGLVIVALAWTLTRFIIDRVLK